MTVRAFFEELDRFGSRSAFVTAEGEAISYAGLAKAVAAFAGDLGSARQLIFLEIDNTIEALTAYLGCLAGGHAVYPHAPGNAAKVDPLIARYAPNLVVTFPDRTAEIRRHDDRPAVLHPDLSLLLSTSGSTGSPKFVKLSRRNIQSNAEAIATYLQLDPDERAITTLKPNYSYGLSVLHSHLECGGSLLLTDRSVIDPAFWTLFEEGGATSFAGVPYTFEVLEQSGFALGGLSRLRYVTQAGGRLDAARVASLSRQSKAEGWRFYVMYGQTEAAPRIAYLPPELAESHPGAIGVPVPGGRILLLDEAGEEIDADGVSGELAYAGPNVMMGYAEGREALAADETPSMLRTGDVAVRDHSGVFSIVGRLGRFVKPFGLRVNLDDVEREANAAAPGSAVTGNDSQIIVAVPPSARGQTLALARDLAMTYGLPPYMFGVHVFDPLPRLANGKIDYRRILEESATPPSASGEVARSWLGRTARIATSPLFFRTMFDEALDILGLRRQSWQSVQEIFVTFLGRGATDTAQSFTQLTGDSLSYVQVSLALEDYLGMLPTGWEHLSQDDLEALREQPATF